MNRNWCGLETQHWSHLIMCQVMMNVAICLTFVSVSICLLWWRAVTLPCGLDSGGQYFDQITQSCEPCPIGMFQEAWQSKPEDCVNKVASANSESRAKLNSSDFYCEKDVPTKCSSCDPSGRYQDAEGQTACLVCPENSERPIGSSFTSISDCKDMYMYKCIKQT